MADIELFNKRKKEDWCRCCRCKFEGLARFFSDSDLKQKYPYCIECRAESRKKSYLKERAKNLKSNFNLSIDGYKKLYSEQKGKCAICKNHETFMHHISKKPISLAVDHCHSTGKIRGLLCRKCNLMIGNSADNLKTLRAAIRYVKNYME